jgi:hypothetical protein
VHWRRRRVGGIGGVTRSRSAGLGGLTAKLPAQYASELRNSVLPVAASPGKQSPEQLNAAANEAQSLAAKISQMCF